MKSPVVVAFLLMALWRLAEAVFGTASKPDEIDKKKEAFRQVKALGVAVVYAGLALMAFTFARGGGKSSSGDSQGMTARLMQNTAGTVALVIAALGIAAFGLFSFVQAKHARM